MPPLLILVSFYQAQLGTTLGPLGSERTIFDSQVSAQRLPSRHDGLSIRMQVTLCRDQRSMTGNLAEHVNRDARVSHPRQAGVAKIMTPKMLVTKSSYHLVPMGRITKHSRGDPPASRASEQTSHRVNAN